MIIGIPKEVKNNEYRIGLTPASVRELVSHDHEVIIQNNAGRNISFDNAQYSLAGARIVETPEKIFSEAEMIVTTPSIEAQIIILSSG